MTAQPLPLQPACSGFDIIGEALAVLIIILGGAYLAGLATLL